MKLGSPVTARYADYIPQFPKQKRTKAQQAGLSFERAVHKRLVALYTRVEVSPWLYFKTPKRTGICQPDALIWLTDEHVCIVEVKLSWMAPARKKLLEFYGPIVQAIYPYAKISYLQIYKNAKAACHKKPLSIYKLEEIPMTKYKECQWLGL
jgi:hypothetical protein